MSSIPPVVAVPGPISVGITTVTQTHVNDSRGLVAISTGTASNPKQSVKINVKVGQGRRVKGSCVNEKQTK